MIAHKSLIFTLKLKTKWKDRLQRRSGKKSSHKKDPARSNIIGGRFVLTLKTFRTLDATAKVQYIPLGYAAIEEPCMVHDVTTLRSASIRLLLSIAAIYVRRSFSHDVSQVYHQSNERLSRDFYFPPKPEDRQFFSIKENDVFKLEKPLYGLCDFGDYWNVTMDHHATEDLQMTRATSDPSLIIKFIEEMFIELTGNYVPENLNAGNKIFQQQTMLILTVFNFKPSEYDRFLFFGTKFVTISNKWHSMEQQHFTKTIDVLPDEA